MDQRQTRRERRVIKFQMPTSAVRTQRENARSAHTLLKEKSGRTAISDGWARCFY